MLCVFVFGGWYGHPAAVALTVVVGCDVRCSPTGDVGFAVGEGEQWVAGNPFPGSGNCPEQGLGRKRNSIAFGKSTSQSNTHPK